MFTVIHGAKPDATLKSKCTVQMNNTVDKFEDFVVVGTKPNGQVIMLHNTDALTIGQAIQLLTILFVESCQKLTPAQNQEIREILMSMEGNQ